MQFSFRMLGLVGACVLASGAITMAADDLLPSEPAEGEWLEDRFDDGSLWFGSSDNLRIEPIARELTDYPVGRRWVGVVDGKPAWVMYYVPGEILGFEVDTHHFGARATEFHFSAGRNWNEIAPIDVDFEEIVAFAAKWMRLYRTVERLPAGTRFLRIEFPADADVASARLTEVWLRCHFDSPVAIHSETAPSSPAPARADTQPAAVRESIPRYVVRGVIVSPPAGLHLDRVPVDVACAAITTEAALPSAPDSWGRIAPAIESVVRTPTPAPEPRKQGVLAKLARWFKLQGARTVRHR